MLTIDIHHTATFIKKKNQTFAKVLARSSMSDKDPKPTTCKSNNRKIRAEIVIFQNPEIWKVETKIFSLAHNKVLSYHGMKK